MSVQLAAFSPPALNSGVDSKTPGLPLSTWSSWLSPSPTCTEKEQWTPTPSPSLAEGIVEADESSIVVDTTHADGVDEVALKASEDALRLNRALQARLQRALEEGLPMAKAKNRAQQARVAKFLLGRTFTRSVRRKFTVAVSFFSDPSDPRTPPPKNKDAIEREQFREKHLKSVKNRRWLKDDGQKLLDTLKKQLKEEAFIRLYGERTKHSMQAEKQKAFKELCDEIKEAELLDLWQMQGGKTDWIKVAKKLELRGVSQSPKNCFTHFIQVLDPRLNRERSTKDEDMALVHLATKYGGFKWDKVAKSCHGRTPWFCFSRYQRYLNPHLLKSEWTDEEDLNLRRVVDQIGGCRTPIIVCAQIGNGSFGGRAASQIRDRFFNRLDSKLKKGLWEPEEVRRLSLAVAVYGRGNWQDIGSHLPGRNLNACLARYAHVDAPELKRLADVAPAPRKARALPWEMEEDDTLISAIERYGAGNWSAIKEDLQGRSATECWRRFQTLNPDRMADAYDVLLATKRKVLPVSIYHMRGRSQTSKRRRSELVAADFQIRLTEVVATTKVVLPCSLADSCDMDVDYEGSHTSKVEYQKLTTGDSTLDRHLKRINWRRQKQAQIEAQTRGVIRDGDASQREALEPT